MKILVSSLLRSSSTSCYHTGIFRCVPNVLSLSLYCTTIYVQIIEAYNIMLILRMSQILLNHGIYVRMYASTGMYFVCTLYGLIFAQGNYVFMNCLKIEDLNLPFSELQQQ